MKKLFVLLTMLVMPLLVVAQEPTPAKSVDKTPFDIEELLEAPLITSIVWAPDGRMFWTEKNGVIGTMSADGVVQDEPVLKLDVYNINEDGLLSIALDPQFEENHYFYTFYTLDASPTNPSLANFIMRYTEKDGVATEPLQLMRIQIPPNDFNLHNGGRLRFGPADGYLYVTIGDMGSRAAAQDFNNISGKIHRYLVSNGTLVPAPNNPYPGNSLWILGVRNTFAFDFDPVNNLLFATENGPECDDEINLIIPGQNYGWTENVRCDDPPAIRQAAGVAPLVSWTPTIAPTGIMIYSGEAFPTWQNKVFYCSFKLEELNYFELNEQHTQFTNGPVLIPLPENQRCEIELTQGPDGYIYYSSLTAMFRLKPHEEPAP